MVHILMKKQRILTLILLLYHELQYNTIRYKNIITNLMAKLNCPYKICLLTKMVSYKL